MNPHVERRAQPLRTRLGVHQSVRAFICSLQARSAAEDLPHRVGEERQNAEHDMQVRFRVTPYAKLTQTKLVF